VRIVATVDLAPLRVAAKARIDSSAEAFRLNFITPGDGQAMAYREKYDEAVLYLTDDTVPDSAIPHIVEEVGVTASTKYQVAQVVVNMRDMWKPISGRIERIRLQAKEAADVAETPAQIEAASQVDWSEVLGLAAQIYGG
jgi:hypothetical protein